MKFELILPRKGEGKLVDLGLYIVPLTLVQLAAVVPEDIDLRLTDENLTDVDFDWNPDLVGISVMTSQVSRAEELSREYKSRGATVLWGGIHPTVVDQSKNPSVDCTVVGEAEELLPKLLQDFRDRRLKRRYASTEKVDLNEIPLPRRELLTSSVDVRVETVVVSRGCYHGCPGCSASQVYGRKIRWASPERADEDIGNMQSDYGAFVDDNFFNNRKLGSEVLKRVAKYNKKWFIQIDPTSALDEEVAMMLGKAGVKLALIGFESVNPENFKGSRKYIPQSEWKRAVDNLHRYGVHVNGQFMLGFDNDGKDIFDRTKEEVQKAGIDIASFNILTPYPGTPLFYSLGSRIFDRNWANYDVNHVVFEPRSLTPEQLLSGTRELRGGYPPLFSYMREVFLS